MTSLLHGMTERAALTRRMKVLMWLSTTRDLQFPSKARDHDNVATQGDAWRSSFATTCIQLSKYSIHAVGGFMTLVKEILILGRRNCRVVWRLWSSSDRHACSHSVKAVEDMQDPKVVVAQLLCPTAAKGILLSNQVGVSLCKVICTGFLLGVSGTYTVYDPEAINALTSSPGDEVRGRGA